MEIVKQNITSEMNRIRYEKNIVILANGEKPNHKIPLNILRNAEKIICCDGAITFLEQKNIVPHIIIGDCDSISTEQKNKYKSIIQIDQSAVYNDLQKAIKYCIANKYEKIILLGASGLREDHFLANIGIIMHYGKILPLRMITNYGIFTPIFETTSFESFQGQQVSVFSFSPNAEISYQGLKYPVQKQKFKELWEGSLNEAVDNHFTIQIEKNAAILVFTAF